MNGRPSHSLIISVKDFLLAGSILLIIYFALYEILLAQEKADQARVEYASLFTTQETQEREDSRSADSQAPYPGSGMIDPQGLSGITRQEKETEQAVILQEKGAGEDEPIQASDSSLHRQQLQEWQMAGFCEKEIELLEINPDYGGILEIPVLHLQYPIARSRDNEEYLSRTFAGEENPAGCIFLDCGASGDYSDLHTFIFGHNRRDGSMFGSLKQLSQNPELISSNPYVSIIWKGQKTTWQIFAFGTASKDDDALYSYLNTSAEYQQWLAHVREISWYVDEKDAIKEALTKQQLILTLSTCYGTDHTQNFVVHAVKMVVTQNER